MNLKRLLYSKLGTTFISILLGLGLASIFRKVCVDRNCIQFSGPVVSDVEGKVFNHDNKCYSYTIHPTTCNDGEKKVVDIVSKTEKESEPVPLVPASLQASKSSFFSSSSPSPQP
jgi:hypothetical protein